MHPVINPEKEIINDTHTENLPGFGEVIIGQIELWDSRVFVEKYRKEIEKSLLTFKNPLEGLDIGLAFGVLTELFNSLEYPQHYKEGFLSSVEDSKPITKDFIRLLV